MLVGTAAAAAARIEAEFGETDVWADDAMTTVFAPSREEDMARHVVAAGTNREANLFEPQDQDHDVGAHGIFGDRAGGFWDPSFLRSLPSTAVVFARAAVSYGAEIRTRLRSRRRARAR